MFSLINVIDFSKLNEALVLINSQINSIELVEGELTLQILPFQNLVETAQTLEINAISELSVAEAALQAAQTAKMAASQGVSDAMGALSVASIDLAKVTVAKTDLMDDAQAISDLLAVYTKNGGVLPV